MYKIVLISSNMLYNMIAGLQLILLVVTRMVVLRLD